MAPLDMKPNELEPYWVPFTPNRSFKKRPRLFSGAKDMHFFTPDGRKVHRRHVGPVLRQRRPLPRADRQGDPGGGRDARLLAALPVRPPAACSSCRRSSTLLAPGDLDYALFANSGTEAVDTALKVALAYHKARGEGARTRFIGRERGYHGVGFGGISVGGMVANRKMFGNMLTGVDHLPTTYNRSKQAFSKGEPEWGARTGRRTAAPDRPARRLDHRRRHRRAGGRLDRLPAAAQGLPRAAARDHRRSTASC